MAAAQSDAAALAGIRVLDLTTNYSAMPAACWPISAPTWCASSRRHRSPVRSLAPYECTRTGECVSFAYEFLDAGKRGVTLDLESAGGREQLARLAATSDVMIETPSVPSSTPDLRSLRAHNPALVLVSISPFGRSGPMPNTGDRLTLLAAGGCSRSAAMPYRAARHPGRTGDAGVGHFRRGRGARRALRAHADRQGPMDRSLGQECVAFALEDAVAEWSINGRVRRRHGDGARTGTGVYPCKDGPSAWWPVGSALRRPSSR
jgi:crotonobetainyl-CoA:carnitine CoA-transferase CaiB-like acyl-CoA transferase